MRQSSYQFGDFIISPARRQLIRDGREVPLIPRYFRVLLVLIQRRHEAVSRRDLLDSAWDDVVVTDNSLNQAVRILRQALGDDSRQPTYIRTVARHGYQFVYPHVSALPDEAPLEDGNPSGAGAVAAPGEPHDRAELQRTLLRAVEVLMDPELGQAGVEARLEAADRLHALGTEAALREIEGRPGAALARALLREARWEVPGAGEVPFLGRPGMWRSVWQLARLRLHSLLQPARRRWLGGISGAALAGLLAGLLGGVVPRFGPGATATNAVIAALPVIGSVIAATGAAGVGLGITLAEVVFRKMRRTAVLIGGALGGALVAAIAHSLGSTLLASLFGAEFSPVAGGLEGLVIGFAAAAGYAHSTMAREGGMATPRGSARVRVVLVTGLTCALGSGLLGWRGSYLGALSLDLVAGAFPGSQVALDPLARLLGELQPGPITRLCVSTWEGLMFGLGIALGLTRRPLPRAAGPRSGES